MNNNMKENIMKESNENIINKQGKWKSDNNVKVKCEGKR